MGTIKDSHCSVFILAHKMLNKTKLICQNNIKKQSSLNKENHLPCVHASDDSQ